MAIKAISLADIVTADGSAISHQAYLLKHSNGHCDSVDWPRPPPGEWTTLFTNLWVRALKTCFIESFGILSSRTLLQVAKLRRFMDSSVIDKWTCFYSDSEDRIFCRTNGDGILLSIQPEASTVFQLSHLKQDQPRLQSWSPFPITTLLLCQSGLPLRKLYSKS